MTPISIMPLALFALAVLFLALLTAFVVILWIVASISDQRADRLSSAKSRISELRKHCEAMTRELEEMEV